MDFAAMFHTWINVLTKPGEAAFEEERAHPQAKLSTAVIWVVVAAVVSAVFSGIGAAISGLIGGASTMGPLLQQMPPEVQAELGQFLSQSAGAGFAGIGSAVCGTLILAPIFFLIGSGLWYLIAKLFGGTGQFEEQTYLLATFNAPIMIISAFLGAIPFVGGCVSFFVWIYQVVLTYFAMKVTHNLTSGKALMVVLVPLVVVFLCAICGFGAVFAAIMAAAGNGLN